MRAGFNDLTTRILGPNSLVQASVIEILEHTPQSYFDNIMEILAVRKLRDLFSKQNFNGLLFRQMLISYTKN